MKMRVLFMAMLTSFLIGCASTEDARTVSTDDAIKADFTRAQTKNTISAFEEFVRKYPDSEYANIAKAKMSDLNEFKKRIEKTKQAHLDYLAMEKIKQYVPGHLTIDQFFSERWNNVDPLHRRIGVLNLDSFIVGDIRRTTVNMGYYLTSEIGYGKSGYSRYNPLDRESLVVWEFTIKDAPDGWPPRVNYESKSDDPPQKVCTLIFKNDQLDSVIWDMTFALQDSALVEAAMDGNLQAVQGFVISWC